MRWMDKRRPAHVRCRHSLKQKRDIAMSWLIISLMSQELGTNDLHCGVNCGKVCVKGETFDQWLDVSAAQFGVQFIG